MRRDELERAEAERRVRVACNLIESAYRLCNLVPAETVASVKAAIVSGAEEAAADVREAVDALA